MVESKSKRQLRAEKFGVELPSDPFVAYRELEMTSEQRQAEKDRLQDRLKKFGGTIEPRKVPEEIAEQKA